MKRAKAKLKSVRAPEENNVDLTQIPGTGLGGRITDEDIEAFIARHGGGRAQPAAPAKQRAPSEGEPKPVEERNLERSPYFFLTYQQGPESAGTSSKAAESTSVDRQTMEYAEVLAHAVDTFGSRTNANAWLNRPNRVFNNRSPLQILTQDPAAVEEELVRIDHGIFF